MKNLMNGMEGWSAFNFKPLISEILFDQSIWLTKIPSVYSKYYKILI